MVFERYGEMNTEEIMEINTEMEEVETIIEVNTDSQYLESIAADVRIIMVLALLTFFMSCMRAWRRNTVRG